MTDSSQTQIAYVPEGVYGTTPATPAFKKLRVTAVPSLTPKNQYLVSDEIRPDRNVPGATLSGQSVGFDLPFEFSYSSFDDLIASFLGSAWSSNVIKNGVTASSFTFENKLITNVGTKYHRVNGAVANTMALNVPANDKVTGSFGVMGKMASAASAIVTGATYNNPPTTDFYEGANDVAITVGGAAVSVRSASFNGTNNNRMRNVVGSKYTDGIGLGRFEVTGQLEAYFNDSTLYDQFLADTYTTLQMVFTDAAAGTYTILFPRIKLTSTDVPPGGNNGDVMANIGWQAVVDPTEGCAMKITRAVLP